MNRIQLRSRVLGLLDETDFGTYPMTLVDMAIDEAQDEIVADFMVPDTHLFRASVSISVSAGIYLYDKPARTIDNALGMFMVDDQLAPVPFLVNAEPRDHSKTKDRALCWYLEGDQIVFWPTPSSARTYMLTGRFYPALLPDAPEFVAEGDEDPPQSTLPLQLQTMVCFSAALSLTTEKEIFKKISGLLERKRSNFRSTLLTAARPKRTGLGHYVVTARELG